MEYLLVVGVVLMVLVVLTPAAVVKRELALWRWRRRARRPGLRFSPRLTTRP
jgi:hypothetical protein